MTNSTTAADAAAEWIQIPAPSGSVFVGRLGIGGAGYHVLGARVASGSTPHRVTVGAALAAWCNGGPRPPVLRVLYRDGPTRVALQCGLTVQAGCPSGDAADALTTAWELASALAEDRPTDMIPARS